MQPLSGQGGALGKKFVYGAIKDKKKNLLRFSDL